MKLAAFQRCPQEEDEEHLRGAALLAIDVGIIMNAPALLTEAQQVISWIEEWTTEQWHDHAAAMEESHLAWEKSQEPLYESNRLAKALVGREYNDPRWVELVDAYREAFPTFIVRNCVFARLSPKQMAFRLRDFLSKTIQEKKLGRTPTEPDMLECLPEAKARLQTQILSYLERALPGFDFDGHPILERYSETRTDTLFKGRI